LRGGRGDALRPLSATTEEAPVATTYENPYRRQDIDDREQEPVEVDEPKAPAKKAPAKKAAK
jgi:hypothetical protein